MLPHRLLKPYSSFLPRRQTRFVTSINEFRFSDLEIKKRSSLKPIPDLDGVLPFGKYISDHMLTVDWNMDSGWSTPKIVPHEPIPLEPSISALHYGTTIFEGLKAFMTTKKDKIQIFRIDAHMERMFDSANRLSLPTFNSHELIRCIQELIKLDKKWTPNAFGRSLYVRPFLFGTDPTLGIRPPASAKLVVLTNPVGAYFNDVKIEPVSLYAESNIVRASPGGVGSAKTGGNYGHTIKVQVDATKKYGVSQVLWVYKGLLTEAGTMNVMVFWINPETKKPELVTPPLNGMILPGVTRQSILDIAKTWTDITVSEREISLDEIIKANKESRLLELFGTGTACVISPISSVIYNEDDRIDIKKPSSNDLIITKRVFDAIADIQYGRVDLTTNSNLSQFKEWVKYSVDN